MDNPYSSSSIYMAFKKIKTTFHFFIFLIATYWLIETLAERNFLELFLINESSNSTQGRCAEMLKKLTQWFSWSKPMVYDL